MKKSKLLLYSLILIQSAPIFANTAHLNVYSFRKYELIEPVIKKFEAQHNIKVNVVNGKSKYLLARLKKDGMDSLADVILSSDLVQLHDHKNLLQPIPHLAQWDQIPSELKDNNGFWVSISIRTRALFSHKDDTSPPPLRYASLTRPQYKGTFCVRNWQHSYNQMLVASLLASESGSDTAWLPIANQLLAKRPTGGDRDQLRALARGQCQYALANHYYWTMMKQSNNKLDRDLAEKLNIHYMIANDGTTPISTTTAAIAKYAPNKHHAQKFIQFLLTSDTQSVYANSLAEYPVIEKATSRVTPFTPNITAVKQSLSLLDIAKKRLQAL
ncbi:extracellular solute-binding protein [Pseudoalteromonas sp. MMG012]|nr:extracellular solute-binding protein [Pseudoalteromonas sp. MMG012]